MGKSKTKRWLSIFDEIKDLGEGGNADVYLVTEKTTGHPYALKELRNRNEEMKKRNHVSLVRFKLHERILLLYQEFFL